ncbi:MAG: hypothetical protein AB7F59_09905 [Bdellovibrionales bacterium]
MKTEKIFTLLLLVLFMSLSMACSSDVKFETKPPTITTASGATTGGGTTGGGTGGDTGGDTGGGTGSGTGEAQLPCPVTVVAGVSVDGDSVCTPWVFAGCSEYNGGYWRSRTCPAIYNCRTYDHNGANEVLNFRDYAPERITCYHNGNSWVPY